MGAALLQELDHGRTVLLRVEGGFHVLGMNRDLAQGEGGCEDLDEDRAHAARTVDGGIWGQAIGPAAGGGKRFILGATEKRIGQTSSKLDKEAVLRRDGDRRPAIALSPETVDRATMPHPPETLRNQRADGTLR
jgi:hypothetical protein